MKEISFTKQPQTRFIRESLIKRKQQEVQDWKISSVSTPILDKNSIDELSEKLQIHSVPEIIFGNELVFENKKNGFILSFNNFDALKEAKLDVLKNNPNYKRIKVKSAWDTKKISMTKLGEKIVEREDNIDWTFTTLYRGTTLTKDKKQAKIEKTEERIDYQKLMKREEILFYEDLCLYEDELHDNGDAILNVKARVMPSSFFILLRYFLRVDNVVIRIMDSRIHHEFDKNYLLREFTHREATTTELEQKNPILKRDISIYKNPQQLEKMVPIIESVTEKIFME